MPNPITNKTTVRALARHELLDTLVGCELAIYLRVIAAAGDGGSTRITNNALRPGDSRPVVRALRQLEELGLIALSYEPGGAQTLRTITVLR